MPPEEKHPPMKGRLCELILCLSPTTRSFQTSPHVLRVAMAAASGLQSAPQSASETGSMVRRLSSVVLTAIEWLDSSRELPILPFEEDASPPLLPGQTVSVERHKMSAAVAECFERAAKHHSCLGQQHIWTTLVSVLEITDITATHVRCTCVGRARASSGYSIGTAVVKPFSDRELEPYDVMACSDYESVILRVHDDCRSLSEKLWEMRWRRRGDEGDTAIAGPYTEPLPMIIASQRAALSLVSSAVRDGIEESGGEGGEGGRECGEVKEEFSDWPTDQMRPHPGLVGQRASLPSLLYERPYSRHSCRTSSHAAGTMPSDSLSDSLTPLPPLWGADHDSAETQVGSGWELVGSGGIWLGPGWDLSGIWAGGIPGQIGLPHTRGQHEMYMYMYMSSSCCRQPALHPH